MLTDTETKLLGVMMMVIMLGMGASLTFRDFLIAFKKPRGVIIGIVCQYGVMPFIGYLLAVVLGLPPPLAVGLILMGCMPGGTTSNIFTYFSKGVLALSIMMTIIITPSSWVSRGVNMAASFASLSLHWGFRPGAGRRILS